MLWLILGIVVAALWTLHRLIENGEGMELYKKIPGPKTLPIFGNSLDIITDRVKVFYLSRKWAATFQDKYRIFVPPFKTINLYNPEDIETLISTTKFNEKSFIYSFLQPWLRDGLLLSHGPKWHTRRKILTPAFHFNILRHFTHTLEENSWKMVRDLEKVRNLDKIDLIPLVSGYTLHSICETAMGTKLDEERNDAGISYKKAIHDIGDIFMLRATRIWLMNDFIFKLSQTGRLQDKVLKAIKSFPKRVIRERRAYHEQFGDELYVQGTEDDDDIAMKSKKKLAMLDLLLSAEKKGLIDSEGIQEEVDTFMFEGHDTTAMGLVFTLMLLANHQDVQEKIVEECKSIFGDSDRPATMSDLQEMKYLECCVKEGLRLYPPVPFISRLVGEAVQFKDYMVPAGTLCHVQILDLHRRADLFSEPLQFLPERFLHAATSSDSKHPYAYIPFSAGPRNCIGQKFAMLEMKSAISTILRTYRLQPVTTPEDIVFISDLVLRSKNPVYVKFVKRT